MDRPASAALNIQCALPAAARRLPMQRCVCHYCSAELPTQSLIKLEFRDRLCIRMRMRTRINHQPIMPGCQVCRLVKLQLGIASTASEAISCCAFATIGGERAGAIASAVAGSQACASICRTVAGSVMKATRRTRLQISRRMSARRSAAACTHCLWPRWLTPRRQLPPSMRRHQFPPRRVWRQHPKIAVPMLAR